MIEVRETGSGSTESGRPKSFLLALVFCACGALAAGARAQDRPPANGPAPADTSGSDPAPAVEAAAVIAPPSEIRLVVRHQAGDGRLVVSVGGRAVFSAPFTALQRSTGAPYERPLSVLSGRQTVTVQVIDGAGRQVARHDSLETLAPAGSSVLAIAEHRGQGKGLTVEWRTP